MVSTRGARAGASPAPRAGAAAAAPAAPLLALVTGGSGFLGRHIVEQLLASGEYEVRVFDIRAPAPADADPRVEYVVGDLRRAADVAAACAGAAVVFHVATAAPTGANAYNHALMTGVNVDGTRHVVEAAAAAGVRALVYTSSASVVFEGKDLVDVDESTPYAARPLDFYTTTKIEGEKLALAANGRGGVAAAALRPSGIFGEYDLLTVPTTVAKARAGKMKYIIGDGRNMMDWTYAGNVAAAHLAAARALLAGGAAGRAGGKAYFITNDDPRPFWGFMGDVCEGLGYGRPRIHLPYALVMAIACFVQYVLVPLLRPFKRLDTDFTPFRITVAASNRTFSCAAAKRDLAYRPAVPMDEALRRTLAYFAFLRADAKPKDS
jgi:sterol-4alpha-carboxylate 3-dehydrogenase (decarboxylating)